MHPKNTTAPPGVQQPGAAQLNQTEPNGSEIPAFTPGQREIVIDLLKAERRHASRWWTFLNELRLHRQLPEWAAKQDAGRHADYDLWEEDCLKTNRELLSLHIHLNALGQSDEAPLRFWTDESAPQNDEVPFRGAHGGEA